MKKNLVEYVRVIVDARDGRKDKWMPKAEAKTLYKEGKLRWDITNSHYTLEK